MEGNHRGTARRIRDGDERRMRTGEEKGTERSQGPGGLPREGGPGSTANYV